jgi:hypothetical protein
MKRWATIALPSAMKRTSANSGSPTKALRSRASVGGGSSTSSMPIPVPAVPARVVPSLADAPAPEDEDEDEAKAVDSFSRSSRRKRSHSSCRRGMRRVLPTRLSDVSNEVLLIHHGGSTSL